MEDERRDHEKAVPYIGFALLIAVIPAGILLPIIHEQHLFASDQQNMEYLGLWIKVYEGEHDGHYPPLDSRSGSLAPEPTEMADVPEYVSSPTGSLQTLDPRRFISPAHPRAQQMLREAEADPLSVVNDNSYWYLGYVIETEEQGLAFVDAYSDMLEAGNDFASPETIETSAGPIYRAYAGINRFGTSEPNSVSASAVALSRVPILIERPGFHAGGSNVLFFDGHVEFMEYPGEFPMTEKFIAALESLDDLKEPR